MPLSISNRKSHINNESMITNQEINNGFLSNRHQIELLVMELRVRPQRDIAAE